MRRHKAARMPERFEELARYNTEVWHGLVHTEEYKTRMTKLQREFNEWVSTHRR